MEIMHDVKLRVRNTTTNKWIHLHQVGDNQFQLSIMDGHEFAFVVTNTSQHNLGVPVILVAPDGTSQNIYRKVENPPENLEDCDSNSMFEAICDGVMAAITGFVYGEDEEEIAFQAQADQEAGNSRFVIGFKEALDADTVQVEAEYDGGKGMSVVPGSVVAGEIIETNLTYPMGPGSVKLAITVEVVPFK